MSSQQAELTADCGRAAAWFGFGQGGGREEQGLQVAIAESVDGELGVVDCLKQVRVSGFERMQCPDRAAVAADAFLDGSCEFAQACCVIHTSERRATAIERFLRDFRTAM